jgi:hypothetical protein
MTINLFKTSIPRYKGLLDIRSAWNVALKRCGIENLRDYMNDRELIFSMIGEALTKEIAIQKDAKGFKENKKAVSSNNFLNQISKDREIELIEKE